MSQMIPIRQMYSAFPGNTPAAQERNAQRWAESIGAAYAAKVGGAWHVSEEARLPGGQTVKALIHCGPQPDTLQGYRVPPGSLDIWSERDRQRFLDTHQLIRYWRELRERFPRLGDSKLLGILQQERGEWAKSCGLRTGLRALYNYKDRLNPASPNFDGNVDRRGQKDAKSLEQRCSPEAWSLFRSLYLHENQHSLASAWRFVAGQAEKNAWRWPSLSSLRDLVRREIPRPAIVLAREGERKFEASCIPKIERDYESLPAGDHWESDERTLDLYCRVPDARKGWRQIRPISTIFIDKRSRMIVGCYIGERANSDTILAAFKMAVELFGVPSSITIDNGKDYRAVGGGRRRKWDDLDEPRLNGVLGDSGVRDVHYATPWWAWVKQQESVHRVVKDEIDRHFHTFCGGSPSEKPATLNERTRDVMSLPTLDQVRLWYAEGIKAYNTTPRHSFGDLSPDLIMQQYRGTVRKVDPGLLDLLITRLIGPYTVGRDGVRYKGILYGQTEQALYSLQGKKVWLRIDPARADAVIVCTEKGVPICTATNARLSGATQEDLRKASEHKGRLRKATRTALEGREFLLDSEPGRVMSLKREAAQRARAEAAKRLPPAPQPDQIHIVRPEISEAAKRLRKPDGSRPQFDAFGRLAEVPLRTSQAVKEDRYDWKDYPKQEERTDAPEEDVFELLRRAGSAG